MTTKLLANATVTLTGLYHTITEQTNEQGKVSFTEVPPDSYVLTITRDGYKQYTHDEPLVIYEDKYNSYDLNITLEEEETITPEPPEEDETRNIIIQTNPAIDDITITLTDNQGHTETQTTIEGEALFEEVPYGSYSIIVEADGYKQYTQNITINSNNNNPRTINVSLEEDELLDDPDEP